jgi:hypothetical protein
MSAPVIQSALFQETLTELETITRVLNAKPKVYPWSVDALEDRQRLELPNHYTFNLR